MKRTVLVEICTVRTEVERELIRSALEARGIEVMFQTFLPSAAYPGLASIKVLVSQEDVESAREVLSEDAPEPNA